MIQGVLFDMDGVLLDSERLGRDLFLAYCAQIGYPQADEALYDAMLGCTREASCRILQDVLGPDFPAEESQNVFFASIAQAAVEGRMPVKRGIVECMQGLKARGVRIALATSTGRSVVESYIQHIPEMQNVFDAMVCGGEAGRSKPAPDIYLEAARRIGVPVESCIGVEDSLNGLKSLTAAGCVSVMIPDLLPYGDRVAPYVKYKLDHLGQLCGLIDRINRGGRIKA